MSHAFLRSFTCTLMTVTCGLVLTVVAGAGCPARSADGDDADEDHDDDSGDADDRPDRCTTSYDCDAAACINRVCRATDACNSDNQCSNQGLVCGGASGCVECNTAADCGDAGASADVGFGCLGHSCVLVAACDSSLDCRDGDVCVNALPPAYAEGLLGRACGRCATANDCASGEACLENQCVDVCTATGRVCGQINGASCGTCAANAVCARSGNACVETLTLLGSSSAGMALTPTILFAGVHQQLSSYVYIVDRAMQPPEQEPQIAEIYGDLDALVRSGDRVFLGVTNNSLNEVYSIGSSGSGDFVFEGSFPEEMSCYNYAVSENEILCQGYFNDDRAVLAMNKSTGDVRVVMQLSQNYYIVEIVVHGGYVYMNNNSYNAIERVPLTGASDPVVITGDSVYYSGMAIDDDNVYWSDIDAVMYTSNDGTTPDFVLASLPPFGEPWKVIGIAGGRVLVVGNAIVAIDPATGVVTEVVPATDLVDPVVDAVFDDLTLAYATRPEFDAAVTTIHILDISP